LPDWVPATEVFKQPVLGTDPNNVHMNHGPALIDAFKRTPPNGGSRSESGRVLPCHQHHDGHKDVYGRIDPTKPAPTMTTACINPSKGRFVHPTRHHGITVREAARIQTFPDSFVFQGGLISAGQQIGNAVPVEFARRLIHHLIPVLNRNRKTVSDNPPLRSASKATEKAA
jgi:DNA (cytosine-5)-methyltransferase 1